MLCFWMLFWNSAWFCCKWVKIWMVFCPCSSISYLALTINHSQSLLEDETLIAKFSIIPCFSFFLSVSKKAVVELERKIAYQILYLCCWKQKWLTLLITHGSTAILFFLFNSDDEWFAYLSHDKCQLTNNSTNTMILYKKKVFKSRYYSAEYERAAAVNNYKKTAA